MVSAKQTPPLPGPDQLFRQLRGTAVDGDSTERILLARRAYADASFAVPRKAYFLFEWALDRLLKTRSDEAPPCLTPQYWHLVLDLLRSEDVKRELKHVLLRIPILQTLSSVLERCPSAIKASTLTDLLHPVVACYTALLPLCVSGSSTDALLSCVGSFFGSSAEIAQTADESACAAWSDMGSLLVQSLAALPTDRNTQKKLAQCMLERCMPHFLAASSPAAETPRVVRIVLLNLLSTLIFSPANLARLFATQLPFSTSASVQTSLKEVFVALEKSQAASPIASSRLLRILPALLERYHSALYSNAGELFAQRSASTSSRSAADTHIQQQLRFAIFGFLQGALVLVSRTDAVDEAAECIGGLLGLVERTAVYIAGPSDANQDWLSVLRAYAMRLVSLQQAQAKAQAQGAERAGKPACSATDALSTLARIDFASIESVLPALLASLAECANAGGAEADEAFMRIAVQHHGKTRQLPHFIAQMETAITAAIEHATTLSPAGMDGTFQGALLSIPTRSALRKACTGSLGTTQVAPLLETLLERASSFASAALAAASVEDVEAEGDTPRRKKRKIAKGATSADAHVEVKLGPSDVASFQIQAVSQLIATVAGSQEALSGNPSRVTELLRHLHARSGAVLSVPQASVPHERAAACILQTLASIEHLVPVESPIPGQAPGQLGDRRLPLLQLVMIRTALDKIDLSGGPIPGLFETSLKLIASGDGVWNGYLHNLDAGALGVALWHLLSQQHLPLLNIYASDEQLAGLSTFILEHASDASTGISPSAITVASTTHRLLHSAEFYELTRLKAALSDRVVTLESSSAQGLERVLPALSLLPETYLDRPIKRKMVALVQRHRGAIGDRVANRFFLHYTKDDLGSPLIKDTFVLSDLVNGDLEDTQRLELYQQLWRLILRNCNASPEKLEDALDFTLRLKSRTFSDAGAASGNVLSLTPALRVYTSTLDILGEEVKPSTVSHTSAGVASEKILEHVQNLESFLAAGVLADKLEYGQSSHLEVCLALSNTCQALAQALLPEGIDMGAGSSIASLLSLRVPGLILAQTAGRVSDPAKVSTRLSWLELACRNTRTLPGGAGDSDSKTGISLETVVGVSLVFAQTCDIISDPKFERLFIRISSKQAEDDYANALIALGECIVPAATDATLATALRIAQVLLCNAPESAARVATQAFSATVRSLLMLDVRALTVQASEAVTAFVKSICEHKIGILELHDVALIMALIASLSSLAPASLLASAPSMSASTGTSKMANPYAAVSPIAGSCANDRASAVFLNMVDIASSIATHRRDLLIPTFPQFICALSGLIELLQMSGLDASASPLSSGPVRVSNAAHAAAAQRAAARFPAWALEGSAASSWLGTKHARTLTRLLVSLGTKTASSMHHGRPSTSASASASASAAASASASGPVSLTGPLSKHAPFLLVAFLRAATDTHAPLGPAVRQALTVGVLEVLGTLGKHEREALMRGFLGNHMEAERALLRALWKEHEKIRYKGD